MWSQKIHGKVNLDVSLYLHAMLRSLLSALDSGTLYGEGDIFASCKSELNSAAVTVDSSEL